MTASEVRILVEREIGDDWDHENPHGVDLRRSLLQPELRTYDDSWHKGQTIDLWLVLEEDPATRAGYKIVFDEKRGKFGLACCDPGEPDCFLGYYGSFFDTLDAM